MHTVVEDGGRRAVQDRSDKGRRRGGRGVHREREVGWNGGRCGEMLEGTLSMTSSRTQVIHGVSEQFSG